MIVWGSSTKTKHLIFSDAVILYLLCMNNVAICRASACRESVFEKRCEMASVAFRMARISSCSQASSDLPPVTSSAKQKNSCSYPGCNTLAQIQSRSCSGPPTIHLDLVGRREISRFRNTSLTWTQRSRGGSPLEAAKWLGLSQTTDRWFSHV